MSTMKMSILSSRAAQPDQQIKLGGKIRCGIKLLTRAAAENPKAVRIYEEGVSKRLKFNEIEKLILAATGLTNPLYPRNTQYFNVAVSDFGMPETVDALLTKYGEMKDPRDGRQLYRFPIVFHSDDLGDIYPNKFVRHGGQSQLTYESHYGDDGQRYCRYLPEVTPEQLKEQKAQRIKRPPRRDKVIRGACDPSVCPEFLQGQCKFRGRLQFYIPGISTGLIGMETSSEYAAEGIWADLERIKTAFGCIPRSNPKNPSAFLFYITKVLEPRTYFDEHGVKKSGFQWVPKLEADIDFGALMMSSGAPQQRLSTTPVAWLEAPKGLPNANVIDAGHQDLQQAHPHMPPGPVTPAAGLDPLEQLNDVIEQMELTHDVVRQYLDIKLGSNWCEDDDKIRTGFKMIGDLSRKGNDSAKSFIAISILVHQLGITSSDFMAYALNKYGKGFQIQPTILDQLQRELEDLAQPGNSSALNYFKAQFERVAQPA